MHEIRQHTAGLPGDDEQLIEEIDNAYRSSTETICLGLLEGMAAATAGCLRKDAKAYGLPSLKGLLIVGIPGTGKSLTAKATASVFNRPLLKLGVCSGYKPVLAAYRESGM